MSSVENFRNAEKFKIDQLRKEGKSEDFIKGYQASEEIRQDRAVQNSRKARMDRIAKANTPEGEKADKEAQKLRNDAADKGNRPKHTFLGLNED